MALLTGKMLPKQFPVALLVGILFLVEVRTQEDFSQLTKSNNEFGFSILKTFRLNENVFFSPASIYTALAMAYGGARNNTAAEMSHTLKYGQAGLNNENIHSSFQSLLELLGSGSDVYKLEIANAVIAQIGYEVLPEYRNLLEEKYRAFVKEVDFIRENKLAVKEVNDWVKRKTHNKISSIVDELPKLTRMILLNAIYFKGTWKKTFNITSTKNEIFYSHGINQDSVPMMKMTEEFPYASFPDKGYQAVELPYKGEDISMLILLPDQYDKVGELVSIIDANELIHIISRLHRRKVDLKFPKFKLEDNKKLKESLKSLGMIDAFGDRADFSGISGRKDLYIWDVLHKAMIEVNEEGSEAAAVTAVIFVVKTTSVIINRTPVFHVNHPFLFFIRDRRTNMILFAGLVNKL